VSEAPRTAMRISSRAESVAPFFALQFQERAAQLEAQGHHVAKLCIGEPAFGAPPEVIEKARSALSASTLPYTEALGLRRLRHAIADYYATRYGVEVNASRILITAGASAGLLLATAALVEPGDEVLLADPSYPCNRQLLRSFGAVAELVPTDESTRFHLNCALLLRHWSARTRGLMLTTPSNPVGSSLSPMELTALCAFARARSAWRIVDETYLGLADPDPSGRPAPSVLSLDPEAFVINSFSKYFGMTGWRLGWCIVPPDLVTPMKRLAQNYYVSPPTLAQYAALACFSPSSLAVCEARRIELVARRHLMLAGLKRMGLSVPVEPDGAFYVYVDIRRSGLDALEFCERALEEAHVALTPGCDFGHCGANTHVRLSYAASREEIQEGLARLEKFFRLRLSSKQIGKHRHEAPNGGSGVGVLPRHLE
jgi:aspartate/methionine/tyrosine aminotransferase